MVSISATELVEDKYIIRTSDRLTFKSCREKWSFGSKIRMNYEPIVNAKPLDFGTAIHGALEVFYDPELVGTDREVVENLSLVRFHELTNEHKTQYLRIRDSQDMAVEIELDFKERIELGLGMLRYYFDWAKKHDNFRPVKTEIEFEVPIQGFAGHNIWPLGFDFDSDGKLYYKGKPVVYQGRVDLIVEDQYGDYWVVDHKTAAQASSLEWLTLDDQIGSYVWALQRQLGIKIKGFLYNELFKKVPHELPELTRPYKGRNFSTNKQQDTTYEMALAQLVREGENLSLYDDFLEYLRENPKQYVRRTRVLRSHRELEILERRIFLEAIDMLNEPSIYPNPSKMACNGCWFYNPCLVKQEGGDVDFVLDNQYEKRNGN